jgi:TRAP-type mannitol/chloroaromatic compound transport system substrate-binding protein
MDRREFLAASAGAIASAAIAPAQALTARPQTPALRTRQHLRMFCEYPSAAAGTFDTAYALSVRLQRILSEGYRIEVATSCIGSIAAFREGAAEIVFASEAANTTHLPALAATTGLPGRFAQKPQDARTWLTQAGGSLWHRLHEATGLQPIYAGPEGTLPSLWSRSPLESFCGLKVASAAPLRGHVLKGIGADLIALAPAEYADALASGTVDAVEMPSVADAIALGLARVTRNCLEGAVGAHSGTRALTFSPVLWRSLTPHERAAVTRLAQKFPYEIFSKTAANEQALKAAAHANLGVNFSRTGEHIQATLDRLSEAVIADFQSKYSQTITFSGTSVAVPLANRETDSNSTHCVNAV